MVHDTIVSYLLAMVASKKSRAANTKLQIFFLLYKNTLFF